MRFALGVALTIGILLAGCGRAQPTGGPVAVPAAEPVVRHVMTLEQKLALNCQPGQEHWSAKTQPVRGGVFRRAATANGAPHLDLFQPGFPSALAAFSQVYQRLVAPRACYYEDTEMVPDLARSWEVSPDGRTWTFRLRPDVRWHNKPPVNGRAFTSADVAWSIERQKQGGVLRNYWQDIQHEEPDAYTVIVRLRVPDPDFLGKLGEPNNIIAPREVFDQFKDFKTVAIGTGPYILKAFKPDQLGVMERNPDYWEMGADGKRLPYIDELQGIVFPDYVSEVAAMRAGQLDMNSSGGFKKPDADALLQSGVKTTAYVDYVATSNGLHFNTSRKPFDDPRVRKALGKAIDPDAIIGSYGGGGTYSGFLSPALVRWAWPEAKAKERVKLDTDGAKKLLAEAGITPSDLKVTIKAGPFDAQELEVVQRQLQNIGVDARASLQPINTSVILPTKDYDVVWGAQSPASFFLDRWLGATMRCGTAQNVWNLCDARLEELSKAQASEMDPVRRRQVVDQMLDRMEELQPVAPKAIKFYYRFFSCQVKNARATHPYFEAYGIERAWIDPAGC